VVELSIKQTQRNMGGETIDNYYAVLNLDDCTVVTVEPSKRSADDTMYALSHPAQPHLCPPMRNILIVPVDVALFIAYSEGKGLELVFDDSKSRVVPIVRIAQRRREDNIYKLWAECTS